MVNSVIVTKDSMSLLGGMIAHNRRYLALDRRWGQLTGSEWPTKASDRQQFLSVRCAVEVQASWGPAVLPPFCMKDSRSSSTSRVLVNSQPYVSPVFWSK